MAESTIPVAIPDDEIPVAEADARPDRYRTRVQRHVDDILLMLDYARERGLEVHPDVADGVDRLLRTGPAAGQAPPDLVMALRVHGRLAKLIEPATPDSIRASSLSLHGNRTLLGIGATGVASFLVFLVLAAFPVLVENRDELAKVLRTLAAGSVGSSFYALYTANRYMRRGTFDPRYGQVYVIRFALGVLAGWILGYVGYDLFGNGGDGDVTYGATTLALVGGFSAEAVAQALQRVADTLVTLIRGSSDDRASADAEKEVAETRVKLAGQLQEAMNGDPEQREARLREILESLLK